MVFIFGYASSYPLSPSPSGDHFVLQVGVTFAWLLFWLVPVTHESLSQSPITTRSRDLLDFETGAAPRGRVHGFAISTPHVVLAFTGAIWRLSSPELGLLTLSGAALYGLATLLLMRFGGRLAYTQRPRRALASHARPGPDS